MRLIKVLGFGWVIVVTAACQENVPAGIEGKSCSRVGDQSSTHDGCCTCTQSETWECADGKCTSGAGGSTSGTTSGSGGAGASSGNTLRSIPADPRLLGDGASNRTGLGGYWWTYVDRSGKSTVVPYTGKIDPLDTATVPASLATQIAPGTGIEGGAYHVRGYVGPEPLYNSDQEEDMDSYWDAFYATSRALVGAPDTADYCVGTTCGELLYPEAGLGFSFHSRNEPLGQDAAGKVGVAFRMKLGPRHELDADSKPFPISVELPMDLTDAPDPTLGDQFGTMYSGLGEPNLPLCTFPNTLAPDGNPVGHSDKSCFRHLTTDGNVEFDVTAEWQTFCLSWDVFDAPPYPPADFHGRVLGQFSRITKLRFDAHRPKTDEPARQFDFFVDDVWLLDQAKWDEICPHAIVPN